MMRIRPEGLWPSPTRRRELHADDAMPEAEADDCRRGGGLSAMASETVLITDKLSKHFGGLRAVSDVDLAVTVNSIHSIIGPNGAGKTTLFNLSRRISRRHQDP